MITILYISILIAVFAITKYKLNSLLHANIIFTTIWGVCAALSSLGLYGLFMPSSKTHLFIVLSIITFNIVYFILNNKYKSLDVSEFKGTINTKLIVIVNIVCWIYTIPFLIKSIAIIQTSGIKNLRAYAFNAELGLGSTVELLILQWIVQSVFLATVLLTTLYMAYGKKIYILLFISIVNIIIYTLLFGGRYIILKAILFYVFSFLIIRLLEGRKIVALKKINYVYIILPIILLVYLTNSREWGDASVFENIIVYFVGPFTYLDVILNNQELSNGKEYLFGSAIFGFIYNVLLAPISFIIGFEYRGSDYAITQITAQSYRISTTQNFNAFTTSIYPFYRDLGVVGIIMGFSFISLLVSIILKSIYRTRSIFYVAVLVYFYFVIFNSVLSYDLLLPSSTITILFLAFFVKHKK